MTERVREIMSILASESISVDHEKRKRIYFTVKPEQIRSICQRLSSENLRLSTMTAVESLRRFELIYHFSDDRTGYYFCPRV